ncbi:MAG TPA: alpha/beta hydrolase [Actinocrinis sp.]|nr:alpha/beta hydrolase [Actinocrinis sp.]
MSRDVLTRPAAPPDHTATYGPDPDQIVDIWRPRHSATDLGGTGPGAPLAVVIHGGFWRAEYDRIHSRPMADALADAGYAVAVPEYRRAGSPGGGGWPGTFDDIAAVLDAVGALAAPFGADPARTGWVGHSAGGHLALWAAARHRLPAGSPWRTDRPAAAGVVSLAGCTSLALSHAWGEGGGAAANLLGGSPERFPERYAAADPAALLPSGAEVVLVHGTQDQQVRLEMSRQYAKMAGEAGDTVTYVELPGSDHFDLIDPLSAAWPSVLDAIASVVPGR